MPIKKQNEAWLPSLGPVLVRSRLHRQRAWSRRQSTSASVKGTGHPPQYGGWLSTDVSGPLLNLCDDDDDDDYNVEADEDESGFFYRPFDQHD